MEALGVLVPVVEACGAAVIVVGALWTFVRFGAFVPVRLALGRFLALDLEFQLAGGVLRTAVAPSFRDRPARRGGCCALPGATEPDRSDAVPLLGARARLRAVDGRGPRPVGFWDRVSRRRCPGPGGAR